MKILMKTLLTAGERKVVTADGKPEDWIIFGGKAERELSWSEINIKSATPSSAGLDLIFWREIKVRLIKIFQLLVCGGGGARGQSIINIVVTVVQVERLVHQEEHPANCHRLRVYCLNSRIVGWMEVRRCQHKAIAICYSNLIGFSTLFCCLWRTFYEL